MGSGELSAAAMHLAIQATVPENSLLWWAGEGLAVTDLQRVGMASGTEEMYPVTVRERERRRTELDQVRLGAVDHLPTQVAIAGPGCVVIGTLSPVARVLVEEGVDLMDLESPDSSYPVRGGQAALVDLGRVESAQALVLDVRGRLAAARSDSLGMVVEQLLPDSTWMVLATLHPRREFDRVAVPTHGGSLVRVRVLRGYELRSIGKLVGVEVVQPALLDLIGAAHSRLGPVGPAVRDTGGVSTVVLRGDTLSFNFAPTRLASGKTRSLFLAARGSYAQAPDETVDEPTAKIASSAPLLQFALGAAYPNPSDGSVTIRYTLARQVPTLLRIYNAVGREVRTLVKEEQVSGQQEALWDGRDNGGRRVSSGVYFYRLQAGRWHSERKLIVLQR
jgi:hypothetical protein